MHFQGRTRTKRPRLQQQQQTYSNAGESIGKMLVEKRISTKLNYDVLRDIEIDCGGAFDQNKTDRGTDAHDKPANPANLYSAQPTDALTITRTPLRARLPSLSSRKRKFSSLGGLSPLPTLSPHPLSTSHLPKPKRTKGSSPLPAPVVGDSLKQLDKAVATLVESAQGSHDPSDDVIGSHDPSDDVIVEESGPVQYCEEEEGLDDAEMEDLIYEDDPLLAQSDTEDYDDGY